MKKKHIIFFKELNCGWVIDEKQLDTIGTNHLSSGTLNNLQFASPSQSATNSGAESAG